MRKRLTAVLLSSGAAAVALGLGSTTAMASTIAATWTVKPGWAVTASGSGQVKDTKTGTVAKCTSIKISKATLKKGSGLSGTGIGTISASSFSGCTIATIAVTVTTKDLPWKLNAVSYNATTGVTTGTLTRVQLLATAPGCSATLEGTTATNGKIKVTYTNSTGVMKLLPTGGNMTTQNVSGCFGLVNNGDPEDASGSLTVSPKQTITSP
jgi:hypothetical protein